MNESVCVTIVTYNSSEYLERCLRSIFEQNYTPLEVVVVDNASCDGTRVVLSRFRDRIRIHLNDRNAGFAAAQNQAIQMSRSDWVLVVNPDVVLHAGFVERLVEAGRMDDSTGTICGRLLAAARDLEPYEPPLIDTAGIYFTPELRHFDRGWHEPDDGRFREREYVFGASAAAALYRREMIDDISVGGNFFDPDFFAYREDADVAWRAQLLGWRCLYVPEASAYHVRSVGPGRRHTVPPIINMHSVKNRFLMRIKNATTGVYQRCWLAATMRDVLVVGGCLLWETTSLPAFWRVAKCVPRMLEQRRSIMNRRRVTDESLSWWFDSSPRAEPVLEHAMHRAAAAAASGASHADPALAGE